MLSKLEAPADNSHQHTETYTNTYIHTHITTINCTDDAFYGYQIIEKRTMTETHASLDILEYTWMWLDVLASMPPPHHHIVMQVLVSVFALLCV